MYGDRPPADRTLTTRGGKASSFWVSPEAPPSDNVNTLINAILDLVIEITNIFIRIMKLFNDNESGPMYRSSEEEGCCRVRIVFTNFGKKSMPGRTYTDLKLSFLHLILAPFRTEGVESENCRQIDGTGRQCPIRNHEPIN